jgi:methylenetetrahydrofolate dehydrogenase (NADP+)/methenyltetrahydrofolate cyclohydrolase
LSAAFIFRIVAAMHLIDGTSLAKHIRARVKEDVATLPRPPKLAVLLVGDDPASHLYVQLKQRAAEEAGILLDLQLLPADISDDALVGIIGDWNRDPAVDAILVQLPLPSGHDADRIVAVIDPAKDADGFHPENVAALRVGDLRIVPPVHEGILRLIAQTPLRIDHAKATILANSSVFADPLAHLLRRAGATVHVMDADQLDRAWLATSDLVVTAVGRLAFLNPTLTKRDAVIIDVGTNKTPEGKTRGDADADAYHDREIWLTPVPGGVGPMTIAQLLANVLALAKRQQKTHA